jgi:hypothetical protein
LSVRIAPVNNLQAANRGRNAMVESGFIDAGNQERYDSLLERLGMTDFSGAPRRFEPLRLRRAARARHRRSSV